jgi:hypothetical protein
MPIAVFTASTSTGAVQTFLQHIFHIIRLFLELQHLFPEIDGDFSCNLETKVVSRLAAAHLVSTKYLVSAMEFLQLYMAANVETQSLSRLAVTDL